MFVWFRLLIVLFWFSIWYLHALLSKYLFKFNTQFVTQCQKLVPFLLTPSVVNLYSSHEDAGLVCSVVKQVGSKLSCF